MTATIVRRLAGTTAVVLLLAGCFLLYKQIAKPPAGSVRVTAVLGEAGTNLIAGSDVKLRDVLVGTVETLELNERAQAVATLIIHPDHRIPQDVGIFVNSKTLLGERYIELVPDGPLEDPPYLTAGDILRVDPNEQSVVEVQDLVDAIDPLLAAIDPASLGAIVDEFGSFTADDARLAARNIEVSAELADFGARTADEQIARLSALADLTGELAGAADDWNRLDRTLPRWVSLLPDRQAAIRTNLDALSSFSLTLAEFLEVEEQTIGDLLRATTIVNGVLADRHDELASLVYGVFRYAFKLGSHGGNLNDGTEFGYFRTFLGGEGEIARLCAALPEPLRANAPGCLEGNTPDEDQSDQGDVREQEPRDEPSDEPSDDGSGNDDGGSGDDGAGSDGLLPLPGGTR